MSTEASTPKGTLDEQILTSWTESRVLLRMAGAESGPPDVDGDSDSGGDWTSDEAQEWADWVTSGEAQAWVMEKL